MVNVYISVILFSCNVAVIINLVISVADCNLLGLVTEPQIVQRI